MVKKERKHSREIKENCVYLQALLGSSIATQKSCRGLGSYAEAMKVAKPKTENVKRMLTPFIMLDILVYVL